MLPSIQYENNGKKAEQIAVKFLQKLGHKVITRNFRIKEGEIDIISINNNVIFANEVKQRNFGDFKYIKQKQIERIWYTFEVFLMQNPQFEDCDTNFQLILVQNNEAQILEII